MEKYIAKKSFTYMGKKYVRGDFFDPDKYSMPAIKVQNRIDAGIIVETARLTEKQIRELTTQKHQSAIPENKTAESGMDMIRTDITQPRRGRKPSF